jgi:hypothetical protein
MGPEGTKLINDRIEISPQIYYFSYPYNAIKESKSGKHLLPSNTKFPFLTFTSAWLVKDIKDHSEEPENVEKLYNDGLVDTFSATHPHDEPHCLWEESEKLNPGVWNVMPITQGDHGSAIGLFEKKDVTEKFYEDMIEVLKKTEAALLGEESPNEKLQQWLKAEGFSKEKIDECLKFINADQ